MLSEVTSTALSAAAAAFHRIADLAPTLGEAELKVLLDLTRRAIQSPHKSCRASTRQLETSTKLSRRNIQTALNNLAARCLITTRKGSTTTSSAHLLNFLQTVRMGGAEIAPPQAERWRRENATPALFQSHPGVETTPALAESTRLTEPPPGVDISIEPDLIDRLLKADPKKADMALIGTARRWLHGYMTKFGRDNHAHPPDDKITAQFLAVADWPRLERLLYDLMAERKEPGWNYAWFVAVALQRIHGIAPKVLKQRRAALKLVKNKEQAPPTPPVPEPEPDPDFQRSLLQQAIAGVKRL